jgi:hypothetical protein
MGVLGGIGSGIAKAGSAAAKGVAVAGKAAGKAAGKGIAKGATYTAKGVAKGTTYTAKGIGKGTLKAGKGIKDGVVKGTKDAYLNWQARAPERQRNRDLKASRKADYSQEAHNTKLMKQRAAAAEYEALIRGYQENQGRSPPIRQPRQGPHRDDLSDTVDEAPGPQRQILTRRDVARQAEGGNFKALAEYLKTYLPNTEAGKKFRKSSSDRTLSAFRDLAGLMEAGGYHKKMPELYTAVNQINDAGFFEEASEILFNNNIINRSKYNVMKKAIHKEVRTAGKFVAKTLDDYIRPQKVAAAILGLVGLSVILSTNSITGAVIGSNQTSPISILWGAISLTLGIFLWFKK